MCYNSSGWPLIALCPTFSCIELCLADADDVYIKSKTKESHLSCVITTEIRVPGHSYIYQEVWVDIVNEIVSLGYQSSKKFEQRTTLQFYSAL